ncbi:MAG: hypothetical protein K0R81_3404 [Microbacterium sp.]|nr:hypothetical protein [Microbacterium sp.]
MPDATTSRAIVRSARATSVVADGGTSGDTSCIAPSRSAPLGVPSGERSIRPSNGSGVSASIPAARSAALFTHAPWWSASRNRAGLSGTSVSRCAALGPAGGKSVGSQPPPTIQDAVDAAANDRTRRSISARESAPARSHRNASTAPPPRWMCASTNPGAIRPPRASNSSSTVPSTVRTSSCLPVATMRPSRTPTASPSITAPAEKRTPLATRRLLIRPVWRPPARHAEGMPPGAGSLSSSCARSRTPRPVTPPSSRSASGPSPSPAPARCGCASPCRA